MAYITNEEVAKKRTEIKNAFPKWKFSITRKHYSTLRVSILGADIQLTEQPNEPVNHLYIKEHYKDKPEVMEALQKIADIMMRGEEVEQVCSDYGSIPNFYIRLSIGEWDKPFVCNAVVK